MVDYISYDQVINSMRRFLYEHMEDGRICMSLPIPGIYDNAAVDIFFSYYLQSVEGKSVLQVENIFVVNPYAACVVATFEADCIVELPSQNKNAQTYLDYIMLKQHYAVVYEQIRRFAFDKPANEEQFKIISEYLSIFTSLVDTSMRSLYFKFNEVFFKWAFISNRYK